ncbi:DNA-processing protein DprA [Leifsonia sp. NPDC058292]|uniref:DNA-processing protein DprA n=1 Tax=Leifsonia sp. NPDC058292 TaxID=3346428 RepID=UPI0036DE0AFD
MGYLTLGSAELVELLTPVTPAELEAHVDTASHDDIARRFATAAFTTLAEPGDTDAALVVGTLGAAAALTAIVERWSAARVLSALSEVDPATETSISGRPEDSGRSSPASRSAKRRGAALTAVERIDEALQRWTPRLSLRTARAALESAAHVGAMFVTPHDALWPTGLPDLGDGAPLGLWFRGDPSGLRAVNRSIALVGARASTGYGEHVAMESAAGLADRGFAVVSGGAYGIDGAAHRATLASEQTTIAFLAGGVDRLYPSGHNDLLTRIAQTGLLMGELPCGSSPTKWRFLQRNRLIAAASRATVVIEAGRRSGSLNTAAHAAAIGRPLGAVPGPVTSPASAGCHRLIQEFGAACVTSAAEMAELAGVGLGEPSALIPEGTADRAEQGEPGASGPSDTVGGGGERGASVRVLDALAYRSARSVRDVAARAGMSERETSSVLGYLELERLAGERDDGWRKLRPRES